MRKKDTRKVVLWSMVVMSLVAAFLGGRKLSSSNARDLIQQSFPEHQVELADPNKQLFRLLSQEDTLILKAEESVGYGGRMLVGTVVDRQGRIREIALILDSETGSYINKMRRKAFFKQFEDKTTGEALAIGHDLDAVSGATISSKAITRAVRNGSHYMAEALFEETPMKVPQSFRIANYEWGIFAFFILSIILTYWLKKKVYRIITYALSILLLGFLWNASFSIAFISRLLMGEIPSLTEGVLYWLFILFFLGGIFIFRKNFYCYSICPFFAVQYFLTKLSGIQWSLHPKIRKYTQWVNGFLLWCVLIIALLINNTTQSSYEPFSMMFSLQGNGVQWFVFPSVLIGSIFISQFFCRYFCPVGALSHYALKARKGKLFEPNKSASCVDMQKIGKDKKIQFLIASTLYLLSLLAILYYLIQVIISAL